MTKKRPVSSFRDTMGIPSDLTSQLEQKIRNLRSSVKTDYLKKEFMSKFVSSDTAPADVRKNSAVRKWLATERENEATNDRLLLTPEDYQILPRVAYGDFVGFCRDLTRDIIGETPPIDALIGSFSGGASTSRVRTKSHPATKYLGEAHVTTRALDCLELIKDEIPMWLVDEERLRLRTVPGNVLFTVPKKTDIDRCACKEPDLNMFMQKGIGSFIRKRLLRIGINLDDQSINRSLAHEGSVTGKLSTLDLSSASDSVSLELVSSFLPEIWFTLLDSVRSHVTIIDGEEHRNHMFSSMGNGFTFELESLLFYVISKATAYFTGTRGRISIYGDDIICPVGMAHDLTFVLSYFGFSINTEKSCYDGPFRESCGGHYYRGLDITPFYVKEPITNLPNLIHVANSLRKWAEVDGLSVLDPEVEEIWLWLKSLIPKRLWGGVDTSYKYQLVSYDVPECRLVEETVSSSTLDGGYYHWLNATWDRQGKSFECLLELAFYQALGFTQLPDSVQTSKHSKNLKRYRYRSVGRKAVPRLHSLFLSELG